MAARLPARFKVRGGNGKALLRQAMTGRVPRAIIERSKKGFPVPTVPLLRRLNATTRDLLLARNSACREQFDPRVIERLLDEHDRGHARWDQEIWCLLLFELWHDVFLDASFDAPAARPQGLAVAG
jgi:asparagine synthase (glutamine-hydrolysing)